MAGNSETYTATLNTGSNTTTGTKTITISASRLADDSALPGAGGNNNGGITITLQGAVGSATADNSGTGSFNGNALTAAILSSGSYFGLSATAASNLLATGAGGAGVEHSVAQILLGHNSGNFTGGTATVGITFRNRMLVEAPSNDSVIPGFPNGTPTRPPLAGLPLISDVARLFGMNSGATANSTTTVQTDPFVFEMSFNPATLLAEGATPADLATRGNIYLASLIGDTSAPGDTWENTIDGDFAVDGSTTVVVHDVTVNVGSAVAGNNFTRPFIGSFATWELDNPGFHTDGSNIANYLSVWGVDPNGDEAWAIINHNSDFAVVPEPSTFVLFAAGFIGLFGYARRRQRCLTK